ncbi:MAG: DUF922 domain-containing protein [Bacteroidia bacterium]
MRFFKKHFILIICFYAAPITILSQQNDSIIWSVNYKLTYTDFKKISPVNSPFRAISNLNLPFKQKIIGDTMFVFPYCYFKKSESWFKKDSVSINNNVLLLAHERGHFDLAEIEVRKLRKKLLELHLTKQNAQGLIQQYANQSLIEEKEIQDAYDAETNFSINKEKQKEWALKIKQQLIELNGYAKTVIKIPVKNLPK